MLWQGLAHGKLSKQVKLLHVVTYLRSSTHWIFTVHAQKVTEIVPSLGKQQTTGNAKDNVHLSAQMRHFSLDLGVKYSADADIQLWVASAIALWSR